MARKEKPKPKRKMSSTPPSPSKPTAAKPSKTGPAPKEPQDPKTAKATNRATKATAPYDDLKGDAPAPVLGNLPWGYGDNRCCGMARDPQWAYAYWEITDPGIQDAKNKLNDPNAWLSLRIYDTTHRDFNGLNAHTHWDIGVDRQTNNFTFKVGRPGATIHVDIGCRTHDGRFMPIARSGAVEMPRDSMSPHGGTETSTVFRSGPGYTYKHKYVAPPYVPGSDPGPSPGGPGFDSAHPVESERFFQHLAGEGWTRSEWTEAQPDGRFFRWIKWSGPVTAEQLAFLPKTAGVFTRIDVLFQGERKTIRTESGERIVYGPWKVVLEAVGHRGEKRTIESWMIRRRWTTEEGMIRVETPAILTRILGGRRVVVAQGASESRVLHDVWGSEMMTQGASEWRWVGASENLAYGSSETVQLGGSETWMMGSSETIRGGASEWLMLGASESFFMGGSERGGASDAFFTGASENQP